MKDPELEKKLKIVDETLNSLNAPEFVKVGAKMITALGGNPTAFITDTMSVVETIKAEKTHRKKPLRGKYTELERKIIDMLRENTGVHLLDSGFVYGRHWERNRKIRDWNKLPVVKVEAHPEYGIDYITVNIYHYLRAILDEDELSRKMDRELQRFINKNRGKGYLELMCEYAEIASKKYDLDYTKPWNSYNWENFLSQVIQGITLYSEEECCYWILQIHNGCDVRGGYTKPRVFYIPDIHLALDAETIIYAYCKCIHGRLECCSGWVYYDKKEQEEKEGFPETWKVIAKNIIQCEKCKKKVKFYSPIEDYL